MIPTRTKSVAPQKIQAKIHNIEAKNTQSRLSSVMAAKIPIAISPTTIRIIATVIQVASINSIPKSGEAFKNIFIMIQIELKYNTR